jgi:hypothetical protein
MQYSKDVQATRSLSAWKKSAKLAAHYQRQLAKSSYNFDQKITSGKNAGTRRKQLVYSLSGCPTSVLAEELLVLLS